MKLILEEWRLDDWAEYEPIEDLETEEGKSIALGQVGQLSDIRVRSIRANAQGMTLTQYEQNLNELGITYSDE